MSKPDFLGRGWAFPLRPDPRTGGLEYREGADKVKQSIYLILDTEPGERVMRPTFGCGLRRYLMIALATYRTGGTVCHMMTARKPLR